MVEKELVKMVDSISKRRGRRIITGKVRGGKRSEIITVGKQGKYLRYRVPPDPEKVEDVALLPTIRAAILHAKNGKVEVKRRDFREKVRRRKISVLMCFVVDSSSSMAEPEKISSLRSALETLFLDAYQKRDRVALISAHGHEAALLSKFTSGVDAVKKKADRMSFGGTTPLSLGISSALSLIKSKISTESAAIPVMVIFTDGMANTPAIPGGDVWDELMDLKQRSDKMGVRVLVVDVSPDGTALHLAEMFEAAYHRQPSEMSERRFVSPVYGREMERALAIAAVNELSGGVLFKNFPEDAVEKAVESIRSAGMEIESTGCAYHCDPNEPDKMCRECRLKYELGILERKTEPMPVVVMDANATPEDLTGRIFLRFLSFPGIFSRANRGLLFIKDVDMLREDTANAIADALASGKYSLEKDGKITEYPVRFSLAGTVGKGEVPGALRHFFASTVDADAMDPLELRIKTELYRNEFNIDPTGAEKREKEREKIMGERIRKAKKIISDVSIPERFRLISDEKRYLELIKGTAAMASHSVVMPEDVLEASKMFSFEIRAEAHESEGLAGIAGDFLDISMVNPGISLLFKNFPEDAVEKAVESIRSAGMEIESTGCAYHCDPNEPDKMCRECRLKYELGILERKTEPMPVVVMDANATPEDLTGRIFLRFLSFPGIFSRANRGLLFIKDVDMLREDTANAIADALASGKYSLEKDGKITEYPVRFSLAGTVGKGEVPGALRHFFASTVDADAMDPHEISARAMISNTAEKSDLKEKLGEWRERLKEISLLDSQLDSIARICYELGFHGNGTEIRIADYARTLAAIEGQPVPGSEHIIRSIKMAMASLERGSESGEGGEETTEEGVMANG